MAMADFRKPHDWVGPTPWEDIKAAFEVRCPRGQYQVLLEDGDEVGAAVEIWNQGIDSRLEAIARPSIAQWANKERTALKITFDLTGLLVFVRRLYEYQGDNSGIQREAAGNLRSAILQSLNIEEEPWAGSLEE